MAHSKTTTKLISLILAQVFLFTTLICHESPSNKNISGLYMQAKGLRVPIGNYARPLRVLGGASPELSPESLSDIFSFNYDEQCDVIEQWRMASKMAPVAFVAHLIDTLKTAGEEDSYKLYRILMNYAGYVRYHKKYDEKGSIVVIEDYEEGHKVALEALRLRPGKEKQDQAANRYAGIFINKLLEAQGKDIHRLKTALAALKEDPGLKLEFRREFPWHYDLIRHFIAYIDQVPEDDSEIGGDITMIGSPARFLEYLGEIYSRSEIKDGGIEALTGRIKSRIENEYGELKLLVSGKKEKRHLKAPRITRQINLDAEAKSDRNKFKWLADNIDKYTGYDAIMLVGSLQSMGPELSPYEYAGLHFDSRYGNDEDFRQFVDAAKRKGIEIIVDVVLNHTGKDLSGAPFPEACYSGKPSPWGIKLDYSRDETILLATWFLRRLKNLGVNWIRCDQMGALGDKGYVLWENARRLGIGIIGEWENFSEVQQADFVYSKGKDAQGIHNELSKYSNATSFSTLQGLLRSRVDRLPGHQSSWVVFDDHDESQKLPIVNTIGKDRDVRWNQDKLRSFYLAVYMAWLSLPKNKRERVSIMEYSGTGEGYAVDNEKDPYARPLSFMYGTQGYVGLLSEGEKVFPGFAGFSQKVREAVKEIIDAGKKAEIRNLPGTNPFEFIVEVDLKDDAGNSIKMYTFCVNLKTYTAHIESVEKDRLAHGMMNPAALLFLRSGQVTTEPKWLKLQVALNAVLLAEGPVTAEGIRENVESRLKAIGALKREAEFSAGDAAQLLDQLSAAGLATKRSNSYGIFSEAQKRTAAIWCNDYDYIREEIAASLGNRTRLEAALLSYEKLARELWPYDLVESFYPILDAVSTMDKSAQGTLIAVISDIENRSQDFYKHPIFNSIRLTLLPSSEIPDDWIEKYGSNLVGKTIVTAAPEISRMKGGLGRVISFNSVAIKRFIKDKARLVWVEPYYNDFGEDPGEKIIDDLKVEFMGKTVQAEVYRSIKKIVVPDEEGQKVEFEIEDYLIRDKERYYVGKLYKYEHEDSRVTQAEFTNFFSSAVVELTNRMAKMADDTDGREGWVRPFLNVHDGQTLSAAFYRIYLYLKDPVKYAALAGIPVSGVTHTYNNRALIYFKTIKDARAFLKEKMKIEEEYHWYFLSKLPGEKIVVDFSSVGLRTSHMPNGVSRIQAFEVSQIDALPLRGISNGDLRELSAKEFRRILLELYPDADVEHPAVTQMLATKEEAKKQLFDMLKVRRDDPLLPLDISGYFELDPKKMIISYSGRLVPEKLGIGEGGTEDLKAFTKENIRRMVRKNAQVIIFGNVQSSTDSVALYRELKELAEEIETDKKKNGESSVYKGTFILVGNFTTDDQRFLLGATDLQGQVSRRIKIENKKEEETVGTEAEGFKEADVIVNGGKQLAAPWIEGGTQTSPGKVGVDLIVPYDNTEEAFWKAFETDIDSYYRDREAYAQGQVDSIPLSRKLNVATIVASYLMWWSEMIGAEKNFDIELVPRNYAMTEANVNLSVTGVQIARANPSLGDTISADLSDGEEEVSIDLRIAQGVEPPRVYVRTNALSSTDAPGDASWSTIPLELIYFNEGKARYRMILKGIKREDCAFTWRVGNEWLGRPSDNAVLRNYRANRTDL